LTDAVSAEGAAQNGTLLCRAFSAPFEDAHIPGLTAGPINYRPFGPAPDLPNFLSQEYISSANTIPAKNPGAPIIPMPRQITQAIGKLIAFALIKDFLNRA
jgi:hypothetical protein